MHGATRKCLILAAVAVAWHAAAADPDAPARPPDPLHRSVVKLYVTAQRWNYNMPWQTARSGSATGSGFVIAEKRILTNAHIVSDSRFLLVQKDGDPRRYRARVTFIGHDCDLATLTVDEPGFYDDVAPMAFADALPRLDDQVTVIGYPLGGTRLSVTRGVVSRIDYSTYAHSGVDQHLVLQVDAAINPGNSGGPIVMDGKVVGLAFQGLSWAENIGYAIPLPVIDHFLRDIGDGAYHGYPELGVGYLDTRNDALRADLGLPEAQSGVVVHTIDPFGSAFGKLKPGDVLTSIDGRAIADDGTIRLNGDVVIFPEIMERKQWGDEVTLGVWRDRGARTLTIPLTNPFDPFVFRNAYDEQPRYVLYGGLVFTPLCPEYLRSEGDATDRNMQQLLYYSQYAKIDGLYSNRTEFVVLSNRLPHPVNTYAEHHLNGLVETVNDRPIGNLRDLGPAFDAPLKGFHVIRFAGMEEALVLSAAAARQSAPEIMRAYGVPAPEYLGPMAARPGPWRGPSSRLFTAPAEPARPGPEPLPCVTPGDGEGRP